MNFGVDFSLSDNLISGTIDLYSKLTKDLLINSNISPSTGFSNVLLNRGELSNKGLEIALQISLKNQKILNLVLVEILHLIKPGYKVYLLNHFHQFI